MTDSKAVEAAKRIEKHFPNAAKIGDMLTLQAMAADALTVVRAYLKAVEALEKLKLPKAESVDCARRDMQNDYKIVAIYFDPQDAAAAFAALTNSQ